jgi:protein-S-isoprenylcysteine O-methyltransferase Ste14
VIGSDLGQRLRTPLGFLLGAGYLALARPQEGALLTGAVVAALGLAIRAWAAGHIAKNERLATSGPYSFVRNPLYVGSFLISAGFALAAHWALILVVLSFFGLIYAPTVAAEERKLATRFAGEWVAYSANVPRFLPRLTPWSAARPGGDGSFHLSLYLRHGEWKAALAYAAALTWLVIRMRAGF